MRRKHRKLDAEANWSTSKSNKQQTEDHSTIGSTKCWKHQKENQRKANDREFANLAEGAGFANVASHAKFAKTNAEAHICAKSSSSHKRKCKCECKCRRMKPGYQEILVKITRNIVSRKKTHCQSQKWELNFKGDGNARFVKTQKENNIVLTVSKKYIADVLLAQRAIWEHVFDVKSIKKDEKWHKIVIHSLKIEIFNTKTEMKNLKTELESYNLELKLTINSIWLSKSENRSRNRHASTILAFRIEAKAQRYLKKRLLAAKSTYRTVEYRDYRSNDQCQKCQIFEHLQNICNRSSRCLYCERNHQIWEHKCQLSTCEEKQSCNHTISRCCNCQNAHFANSAMCETYQAAQSISSQKDHLVTKL